MNEMLLAFRTLLTTIIYLLVVAVSETNDCYYSDDVSQAIRVILCSVETKVWQVSLSSPAVVNSGCLLGANR